MTINVTELLREYQASVPVNVEGFIRTVGANLQKNADLPAGISGQVLKTADGTYTVSTARNEHYFRQRFTMAHELGHLLLHRSILDKAGGTDDNVKYRNTVDGNFYNSDIDLVHEQQANSFAANLLMPTDKVIDRVSELEKKGKPTLQDLYRAFQVSASAMKWRLKSLGLSSRVSGAE